MPTEGSTRGEILPGCSSLDKSSRDEKIGFEPHTLASQQPSHIKLDNKGLQTSLYPAKFPLLCEDTTKQLLSQTGCGIRFTIHKKNARSVCIAHLIPNPHVEFQERRTRRYRNEKETVIRKIPVSASGNLTTSNIKKTPVCLTAFIVRTLKRSGKQASPAHKSDSLDGEVCCASKTRIQDSPIIVKLTAPSSITRFRLHTYRDLKAIVAGYERAGLNSQGGRILAWLDRRCLATFVMGLASGMVMMSDCPIYSPPLAKKRLTQLTEESRGALTDSSMRNLGMLITFQYPLKCRLPVKRGPNFHNVVPTDFRYDTGYCLAFGLFPLTQFLGIECPEVRHVRIVRYVLSYTWVHTENSPKVSEHKVVVGKDANSPQSYWNFRSNARRSSRPWCSDGG
ncbi:hypothetical protein CLF_109943 [Clonorchis sinensis]|uniref:Uncharacterized protein n=1 Tax=Clonorchis sinensis TaxID=79923 RepID=G7YK07_CLOSI|nr:hypothetical protein CLF_109943 [Clonorchis sinensis]